MRFESETLAEQTSTRQPGPLLWLFAFFVPSCGPTFATWLLMRWSLFAQFTTKHHDAYFICFFLVQIFLICASVVFLSKHYGRAIWLPRPKTWGRSLQSLWFLVPILLLYVAEGFGIWHLMLITRSLQGANPGEFNQMLGHVFEDAWSDLAYGASFTGIICYTVLTIISPALEEILFSGLLANLLFKRSGVRAAAIVTPFCFALVHSIQFGFGPQLVPLYFAGLTYTMMRFYSGNLAMSVLGHITVNLAVLFPKWIIAAIHFGWL